MTVNPKGLCSMAGAAIFAILTAVPAQAQIIAPGGRTVFNQAVMLRSFVEIRNFSLGPNSATAYINPYAGVWGFAPNWNLTVVVPLVALNQVIAQDDQKVSSTTVGLGDGLLLLKYDGLYRRNRPGGFTRLAGEFGLKLPTGNSTFGTGSTDFVFDLVYERVSGRHWIGADAQYVLTSEGREGLRGGNTWNYDYFISIASCLRTFQGETCSACWNSTPSWSTAQGRVIFLSITAVEAVFF